MGNPVVHFEVYGANSSELRAFYAGTFGWKLAIPPGAEFAMVDTDSGRAPAGLSALTFWNRQ